MAQVDGTPAGAGDGNLAGTLRAAVPTEEAVRAAALPGEERCGDGSRDCTGTECLAAADMRGFEDGPRRGFDVRSCARRECGC